MRTRLHEGSIILIVAESDKRIHQALKRAWDKIMTEDSRVPDVVIGLTPGRASSCTSPGWRDETPILEVNLRPGGPDSPNSTGADVLTWLLHQAAHGIAGPVTGQEGRAHSTAFRTAATALGLTVDPAPTGWGKTSLAPGTQTRYRSQLASLDRALSGWEPTQQVKATRDARNGVVLICSCDPPRKIRLRGNPETIDIGAISCGYCGELFTTS